jgi:hypothetical protein
VVGAMVVETGAVVDGVDRPFSLDAEVHAARAMTPTAANRRNRVRRLPQGTGAPADASITVVSSCAHLRRLVPQMMPQFQVLPGDAGREARKKGLLRPAPRGAQS